MVNVEVQYAHKKLSAPGEDQFQQWSAVIPAQPDARQTASIRVVDENEIAELNLRFRQKSGVTNVLAFPADIPDGVDVDLIGDIIICAPIVIKQAREQGKTVESHWAHMTLHGILHLLGYDHIEQQDAVIMETLEIQLMAELGYPDPYR